MKKTLYFVRHGETEYNRLKIVQGKGINAPLNETGMEQAMAIYKKYKNLPFEVVFTSTLIRTHQTVEPFIDQVGRWVVSPAIDEIGWGVHEGKTSSPEMLENYSKMISAWKSGDLHAKLEGGESAHQLSTRLNNFLRQIVQRSEKNMLICTHGRSLRCLMCLLKGEPLAAMEKYDHHNTGVYEVHWDGKFSIIRENDISHLKTV